MAQTRITISLSPEQIQQLDEKRKQMGPPAPSRARAVVMLLQDQLGGHDHRFELDIRLAGQSDAGPGEEIDVGPLVIRLPNDVERPTH
jgi:hypothetical protein